jgi:hypothetical protein
VRLIQTPTFSCKDQATTPKIFVGNMAVNAIADWIAFADVHPASADKQVDTGFRILFAAFDLADQLTRKNNGAAWPIVTKSHDDAVWRSRRCKEFGCKWAAHGFSLRTFLANQIA